MTILMAVFVTSAAALYAPQAAPGHALRRAALAMEVKSWYDEKVKVQKAEKSLLGDSEYVLEQRRKMQESSFGAFAANFDFSGKPRTPPVVRGKDGLNDQGYKAPPPPSESGIPAALIPAVALIGLLTAYNQGLIS